ncbi:elongation of very long chain fatty acids protein F-like [Drosophila sulfurigaster albostrigata]|uniref:elongation of very long chain fatty acids protein F-like n=1 Tax=Drosophila sulfurigaster albostrigata TaxID=89887 RepID=UPI002D21B859|nr:elongation of very long chain fatty acids protein F-like [Drosophila sulfurigaster albostrigata]
MFSRVVDIFNRPFADPVISNNLPFVSSPWPIILILGTYLTLVKVGKKWMEHRKPYDLKNIILAYNIFQIVYNAVLCYYVFFHLLFSVYDLQCMETLPLDHPSKTLERTLSYAYFINKITDLVETIFFVLRKSNKQITFLHIYHHLLMVSMCYVVLRFYGTGSQFSLMGALNTFVHTVMYFYYFISARNPNMKSSVWWKKYITLIQLVQFSICFVQSVFMLLFKQDCKFPLILQYLQLTQAIVMIYMFSNFYLKAYVKPKQQQKIM